MSGLNETHAPGQRSWVASANEAGADFPIQNLPYGVFSVGGSPPRCGVAIGDRIVDLAALEAAGLLRPTATASVFDRPALNDFMALGPATWHATRRRLWELLHEDRPILRDDAALRERALVPIGDARLHLPIFVRSFTDFYASRHHASNVGTMFRGPEKALPPNWLHMPIAYNGRASTVAVSGDADPPAAGARSRGRTTRCRGSRRARGWTSSSSSARSSASRARWASPSPRPRRPA